jgi:hypothetical protein
MLDALWCFVSFLFRAQAREIAQNAVAFVRERLHLNRVHCYWARLLSRYRFDTDDIS